MDWQHEDRLVIKQASYLHSIRPSCEMEDGGEWEWAGERDDEVLLKGKEGAKRLQADISGLSLLFSLSLPLMLHHVTLINQMMSAIKPFSRLHKAKPPATTHVTSVYLPEWQRNTNVSNTATWWIDNTWTWLVFELWLQHINVLIGVCLAVITCNTFFFCISSFLLTDKAGAQRAQGCLAATAVQGT